MGRTRSERLVGPHRSKPSRVDHTRAQSDDVSSSHVRLNPASTIGLALLAAGFDLPTNNVTASATTSPNEQGRSKDREETSTRKETPKKSSASRQFHQSNAEPTVIKPARTRIRRDSSKLQHAGVKKRKSTKVKPRFIDEQLINRLDAAEREVRGLERSRKAAQVVARIGECSMGELAEAWNEHARRLGSRNQHFCTIAKLVVQAVESEWQRRKSLSILDPDYFPWPRTDATRGSGDFGNLPYKDGILGYLGYHVGETGEALAVHRHLILDRIQEGQLPPLNGPQYMDEWGDPRSAQRLKKTALTIASMVRAAKRRTQNYAVAISHWEGDLEYLRARYYIGRFRFEWPSD